MMLAAFIGGFWPTIFVAGVGFLVGQWVLETAEARPMGPGAIVIYAAFALAFAIAGAARQRGLRRAQAQADRMAELQRQMVRVSRLNAMGEMAGSLAHELNQPLTAIANYLNAAEQLLGREDAPGPRVSELIRKAGDQAVRAGRIVARARSSLDRGEIVASEESVAALVTEAVEVARAGIARDSVVIRYEFDRTVDRVLADRLQVQQVILNLVRNAVEAMAERSRRELKIAARAAEPGLVQLSVADTGPGISPEVADRLFQPFVTAKPDGMGVGLSKIGRAHV
jgi:two-component system sensor kinase FixL